MSRRKLDGVGFFRNGLKMGGLRLVSFGEPGGKAVIRRFMPLKPRDRERPDGAVPRLGFRRWRGSGSGYSRFGGGRKLGFTVKSEVLSLVAQDSAEAGGVAGGPGGGALPK